MHIQCSHGEPKNRVRYQPTTPPNKYIYVYRTAVGHSSFAQLIYIYIRVPTAGAGCEWGRFCRKSPVFIASRTGVREYIPLFPYIHKPSVIILYYICVCVVVNRPPRKTLTGRPWFLSRSLLFTRTQTNKHTHIHLYRLSMCIGYQADRFKFCAIKSRTSSTI